MNHQQAPSSSSSSYQFFQNHHHHHHYPQDLASANFHASAAAAQTSAASLAAATAANNLTMAAMAAASSTPSAASSSMTNAFVLGQTSASIEDLYYHQQQHQHYHPSAHPHHQIQHQSSLVYPHHPTTTPHHSSMMIHPNQAAAAAAYQRYVLPASPSSTNTAANSFNASIAAAAAAAAIAGTYPQTVDHLASIKYQQQQQQQQNLASVWRSQGSTASHPAALFPSIFQQQQQQVQQVATPEAYFNAVSANHPSSSIANHPSASIAATPSPNNHSPLAGLRALSEQYSSTTASYPNNSRRAPKSPTKSSTSPIAAVAAAATNRAPSTNSPGGQNSFIPPSPVLKSAHNKSPSSNLGQQYLVGSPATAGAGATSATTARHRSGSSSAEIAADQYSMSAVQQQPPSASSIHHQHQQSHQIYDESLLNHPSSSSSSISSFYAAHGIDPNSALIDPTAAAASMSLFQGVHQSHVIGNDPNLHSSSAPSAVDDAFSVLTRGDVNTLMGDLGDCANMMVGNDFWNDLGDSVLDDTLLGGVGGPANGANELGVNGPHSHIGGPGGLLHSVLEFGTPLGNGGSGSNGHASTDEMASFRYQDELSPGKRTANSLRSSIISNDISSAAVASAMAPPTPPAVIAQPTSSALINQSSSSIVVNNNESANSTTTGATPKLREKMKRRANHHSHGENEFSEIDRAFARHLSMVAERNEGTIQQHQQQFATKMEATSAGSYRARLYENDRPLDTLTADQCLSNRLQARSSKYRASNMDIANRRASSSMFEPSSSSIDSPPVDRSSSNDEPPASSPVHFEQIATGASLVIDGTHYEMDDLKRDIRKMLYAKKREELLEKTKIAEAVKRRSLSKTTTSASIDEPIGAAASSATSAPEPDSNKPTSIESRPIGKLRKSEKIPIYKQKSIASSTTATSSANPVSSSTSASGGERISERRRRSTQASISAYEHEDSPYNFTDDDETAAADEVKKEQSSSIADDHEENNSNSIGPTPMDEAKQKLLDEEVAKKLQQISSLHPELKISSSGGNGSEKDQQQQGSRHVLPKKRQSWQQQQQQQAQMIAGNMEKMEENRNRRRSTTVFVKTEILTDDYSTAMPTYRKDKPTTIASSSTNAADKDTKVDEDRGATEKILLPKLIIRIPKKCLEQNGSAPIAAASSATTPAMDESDPDWDRAHHHHHRKRKREKRKRRESEYLDGGEDDETMDESRRKRHKRRKSRGGGGEEDDCGEDEEASAKPHHHHHHRRTSENETSDQDVKDINLIKNAAGLIQEKRESGSNGFEWDRLPFKLRKKLQTSSDQQQQVVNAKSNEPGSLNNNFSSTTQSGSSEYHHHSSAQSAEDEHREMAIDNEQLTSLRLRFPSGPVFQKGAFVVCKDDIGKPDCPVWKVDSQNLLQKFSPMERNGKIVYVSTSTFAGWCLQNQELYVPVQVRYVVQSRSESIVELESSLEDIFPAISTEMTDEHHHHMTARNGPSSGAITGVNGGGGGSNTNAGGSGADDLVQHPQAESLVAYVHVLLLHAVLGNAMQGLRNSHHPSNVERVSEMKDVDLVNAEKCRAAISCVSWQQTFKESVEWYSHCTVSEDEGFGLQCQACSGATVSNVLQLFGNEGYDFDTLEPRPPRTTVSGSPLPSQDYHLCSSCAKMAVRYHKLFHMRYHLFRKCEDAVELIRDGNPTLAAGAIAEACIKDQKWLATTVNEYLQLWTTVS